MFTRDFDTLNDLYLTKVINESNLGPLADQGSGSGLSPDKIVTMKPPRRKCKNAENMEEHEECEDIANHEETNADMTKQSLFRLVKLTAMLHDLICQEQHVEPWVLTKVTEALNHIESVYGYMDYENYKSQVETDITNIEEETEADLYKTIISGGSRLLAQIKQILATESKENLENLLYETIHILETKK